MKTLESLPIPFDLLKKVHASLAGKAGMVVF
jgi:hypothetical protein